MNKNGAILLICGIQMLAYNILTASSAVTYELGDRLGDNLLSYCHARWVAYKHDIPLYYTPFKYSEYFELSRKHKKRGSDQFKNTVKIPQYQKRKLDISSDVIKKNDNALYVIPFFPQSEADLLKYGFSHFEVDWYDEQFIHLLREEIRLIVPLPKLTLPENRITVAVHLRKGSGPDGTQYRLEDSPLRFAPDSFFIEQIKNVSERFHDKPMYVHFFTDHKNPTELVEKYKAAINKPNIVYNCCILSAGPELNVLEDFFNMTLFDCIIRPESHFSLIASILSHAKVVIYPVDYMWKGKSSKKKKHEKKGELVITKVATIAKTIRRSKSNSFQSKH